MTVELVDRQSDFLVGTNIFEAVPVSRTTIVGSGKIIEMKWRSHRSVINLVDFHYSTN